MATDLFAEAAWADCARECRRHLALHPGDRAVELLKALSDLHRRHDSNADLAALAADAEAPAAVTALAAYELGREHWRLKQPVHALPLLRQAFEQAPARDLFLRAGCSLSLLIDAHDELEASTADLEPQLKSCRPLWTRDVYAASRLPEPGSSGSLLGKPGQWVIAFYRAQISPALGQRCSLHPSCSEYARQALARHGLLGFTFYADRGVREPDLVGRKASPVKRGNRTKYADPLSDHDWWMED